MDRGTSVGPRMACKGASTGVVRSKQQGLFGVDDDGYLHGASKVSQDAPVCDEKLQDTIRFVFRHEQEGLLAIGTFALEQLSAVRDAIDEHQNAGHGQDEDEDGFESYTGMMQSSDDEDAVPRSWLAKARTDMCESEAERGPNEEESNPSNQCKAVTLYKHSGSRTPIAGVRPIVLLTALPPELRKVFDPAKSQLPTFVPHWTDSVPPPVLARSDGPCADEESYYAPRFCGLFGSKKKISSNYKRLSKRGTVHFDNEEAKKLTTKVIDPDAKKSMLSFGSNGMPSLGKLAKMWRSSCKQSSARIAPEREPYSPRPSQEFKVMKTFSVFTVHSSRFRECVTFLTILGACRGILMQGPPCGIERGEVLTAPAPQPQSLNPQRRRPTDACSSKVAEFRRRVAMQERNKAQAGAHAGEVARDSVGSTWDGCGHWVKTDSECKS
jgi:hypothetical protein